MRRMRELIRAVTAAYPQDDFFSTLNETLNISSQARAFYRAYDRAFSYLDQTSWLELSRKATAHFLDHREGQLKQGFFNQLNDAFAYQFLVRRGCSRVSVLCENSRSTPDLEYFIGTTRHFCEVKTIGISQDEIARRGLGSTFDNSVYQELSSGFLRKLDDTLILAQHQISANAGTGLVFVLAQFDDFTLSYYDRYREQLSAFLNNHVVPNIYVKVGLVGGRRIGKGLFSNAARGT